MKNQQIWCCACKSEVDARLTNGGGEIYPHRPDLRSLPSWKCEGCSNFVGCQHKTKNPMTPLDCIPTPEIKSARQHIYALLDPIWQSGMMGRKEAYAKISERLGWTYHTAKTRSIEEAREVCRVIRDQASH